MATRKTRNSLQIHGTLLEIRIGVPTANCSSHNMPIINVTAKFAWFGICAAATISEPIEGSAGNA
jgi:hypothetical protein